MRRSTGAFALIWAAAGACIVRPPSGPTAVDVRDYPSRKLELANGLRVVLEEAPDFGAAGAVLVVGAGSADDPPGKAGVAHLAEHIVFDATHEGVSFYDWSRNLNGGVNAMTTWDTTTYHAFQRTPSLPAMLTYLHGVVTEPLVGIDGQVFQREWRAVSNERRNGTEEGTPGQAEGWLIAASFAPSAPYGHSPAGTADSLAHVTFDDVRAFVATHYRPDACTLMISAPLPLDAQQKLVESITGQAARAATMTPHAPPPPPPTLPRSFETREADVATPTLWIGWPVPSDFGARGDLAPLVASIVTQSAFSELGDRDRDVGMLRAGVIEGAAASLFFIRVTLKEAAHPAETAGLVVDQLQGGLGRLGALGVSTAELTQFVATGFVYRQEALPVRALDAARSYQLRGDPTFLRRRGARMIRLAYAEVDAYVHDFLRDEQAHVVLVRPGRSREAEPEAPPPAPATALVPASASASPARPPGPSSSIPDGDEGRALAGMQARDLANGLHVIVVPRKGSPFHTAVIGFRGGLAQADPPGVVIATGWGRRWSEKSPRISGIDWESHVSMDATFDELHATGSDVQTTLKHLHRMLRGFSMFWPPREFDKRVEVMERQDHAVDVAFDHRMRHAIYGDQALGTLVTAKQIRRIAPAEVNHWVDRVRRPSNAVLVLVGDLDPQEALDAAAAELESWGAGAQPVGPPGDPYATDALLDRGAGPLIHNRREAKQVGLRLMCLLPKATAGNYAAEIVFADTVKRSLLASWREELGASYSVHGGVDVLPGGSAVLDLAADVDHARLVPALRGLRAMLAPAAPVPGADRLESTRRGTADRFRIESATSGTMAMRIMKMWTLRWPVETLDRLPTDARAAGLADLGKIAEHCRANAVVGMLGDETRLRAAWSESGN